MSGFMGGAGFGPSDGGGGGPAGAILREYTTPNVPDVTPVALPYPAYENTHGNGYIVSAYLGSGDNAINVVQDLFIVGPAASSTAHGLLKFVSSDSVGFSLAVAYWATA